MKQFTVSALLFLALLANLYAAEPGLTLHLSPTGDDANPGTAAKPLATLAAAQRAARASVGQTPVTVLLHTGVYYLPETVKFTPADSGTGKAPVAYAAAPGEQPVISGGMKLTLDWSPFRDGIFQAKTPSGLTMDQLFFNGQRQHMARYPNYDPAARQFNGSAADAIAPERVARWADPTGGYIHAMHPALWGDMHWRILGKKADGSLDYEGGWQNNRPGPMHKQFRFVENIREELDAPGEWFHDAKSGTLYFYPPTGVDLKSATIEVVRLRHLIEFNGSKESPVRFITLHGLTFRHAARTFMENREPLLRTDWTVYRGGAVMLNGAEDAAVEECEFDQLGGNTVFVNNYNRRITVRGCLLRESGANGIAFVGDPKAVRSPLFNYGEKFDYAKIDRTPGPLTENYPADCLVEDCLITRSGRFEKQTAPVEIDIAQSITVRHCSIYDVPRAGINIGDGCWGGHIIEHCDIFETVLETGDHGSFNSWGRDRYWHPSIAEGNKQVAADPNLPLLDVVKPIILRHNRWRCDHGWDIDLDDGSSHYEIYNNLLLHGGLKLREGFFRKVYNNITVGNSLHPHCWYDQCQDEVTNNIFMGAYRPAGGMPKGNWGKEVDRNLFTTNEGDRGKFAANGCDAHSVVGDPQFIDATKGDYRVKEGSPALGLGFKNFAMEQFGVLKPELRKIARTPELPGTITATATAPEPARKLPAAAIWLQANVKALEGEEYSAFGVSKDAGGIQLIAVPVESAAAKAGLQKEDLLLTVNGKSLKTTADLAKVMREAAGQPLELDIVRNQQPKKTHVDIYPYVVTETSADEQFKTLALGSPDAVVRFATLTTTPKTSNEPVAVLTDGKLARNYGPVFGNGTACGIYKADLGKKQVVQEVNSWSYSQGGRGVQHFVLYGSASESDPGWTVTDSKLFTPIAEVNTTTLSAAIFNATSVRQPQGTVLGSFRWLLWVTYPLNQTGEHTAFQEFQVKTAR